MVPEIQKSLGYQSSQEEEHSQGSAQKFREVANFPFFTIGNKNECQLDQCAMYVIFISENSEKPYSSRVTKTSTEY